MGEYSRPSLCGFSDQWILDGDYIRCRHCKRPQIVSLAHNDFNHRAGCCGEKTHDRNPWKTLASLITSEISRAAHAQEPTLNCNGTGARP